MKISETVVAESHSITEVCRKIGVLTGGYAWRKVKGELSNYDTSHFVINGQLPKYSRIKKLCPVCDGEFVTSEGSPREQITCSRSCSNTQFRSGKNHPNWKHGRSAERARRDRTVMVDHCEICGTAERLCYDHDHKTGEYRGTLCSNCNTAIGLMKDTPDRLVSAAKYVLERK